jgi:SAM-dependent methyltransferase
MIFKNYAKYYDEFYADKNYESEVAHIVEISRENGVLNGEILDIGCGSGSHAYHFINSGYRYTGIDLSEDMILEARKKLKNHSKIASFEVADARHFNLGKKFELITALFHVASYQTTNEDLENFFGSIAKHLKKNGIAIFDCWNGPGVLRNLPETRVKEFEKNGHKIWRIAKPSIFPNENVVEIEYQILDSSSKKEESLKFTNETHRMRYLFCPELNKLLKENNLKIINTSAWQQKELKLDDWHAFYVIKPT